MTPEMWLIALGFAVGVVVGGLIGITVGALCNAADEDKD